MSDHNEKLDQIEELMDSCDDLSQFLDLVAKVCSAKADHLEANWQDQAGADHYSSAAGHLLNIVYQMDGR